MSNDPVQDMISSAKRKAAIFGGVMVVGISGILAGADLYLGKEKDLAPYYSTDTGLTSLKPKIIEDYEPILAKDIRSNKGLIAIDVIPSESIYLINNSLYVIAFEEGNLSFHAVANPADLSGGICSYDNAQVVRLNQDMVKLLREGRAKDRVTIFGDNIAEDGDPYILLHKVQVGPTVYNIMRCKE